ncbi:hypothetical protein KRMM14A1259_60580 [Krasilnikovia sp. MM14-A1259]
MTRTIRSRRAPASQQPPLYARMLRLRHLAPSGFLCFALLEGTVAVAVLLALAELVSWWGVLVLPVTVAAMVKLNDVIAGAVNRPAAAAAAEPARTGRTGRNRTGAQARIPRLRPAGEAVARTGPTLRSAVAPPPPEGLLVWTPPYTDTPEFGEAGPEYASGREYEAGREYEGGRDYEAGPEYDDVGHASDGSRREFDDSAPAFEDAGFRYENAGPETGYSYGAAGLGRYSPVDLRARVDVARAAIQAATAIDALPLDEAPTPLNEAPTARLWADELDAEQRARQAATRRYE